MTSITGPGRYPKNRMPLSASPRESHAVHHSTMSAIMTLYPPEDKVAKSSCVFELQLLTKTRNHQPMAQKKALAGTPGLVKQMSEKKDAAQ